MLLTPPESQISSIFAVFESFIKPMYRKRSKVIVKVFNYFFVGGFVIVIEYFF